MIGFSSYPGKSVTRFYFTFIILLMCGAASGQHSHSFFYGTVSEEGTKRPLQGVNLHVEGTRTGTVTDRKGAFSFFTDSIPARLTVSHVGFETKTILLDETSYSLSLYLSRKAEELKEVEIKANLLEPFYKDDQYSVLDFDIDSSRVWLLIFRQKRSQAEMVCLNLAGDTLAVSGSWKFRPTGVFRDCIGNLHVLGRDSGFQVFRSGNQILLIHPVKLKKFEDVLKNCVASTSEVLFFRKVINHGLAVEFYGVNRATLMQTTISRVSDEKILKMQRRNQEDASLLMNARPPDSRDDFVNWNYVHKVLYRPVKAMLCQVGAYTCIFNMPAGEAEFYDQNGNFSYKLTLNTSLAGDGRWTRDAEIDKTTGKVYTTFMKNGKCTLYEIDLNNGNLVLKLSLAHPFPERIRVYNGWVYYLYDLSAEADNRILYRQKM